MSEFQTRTEVQSSNTVRVVEGRLDNVAATFTTCIEGEDLFNIFLIGVIAAGHTV